MKAAVTFLVILGLVAAVSAMLLVKSLTGRSSVISLVEKKEVDVEILVASRNLRMRSIVDTGSVARRKVPSSHVPQGALTDPVQVVGKVLTAGVVEGQPFTQACFSRESIGVHLAASLPQGKRAISISLSDWSGMAGLLYPGSVVDVLVSFKAPGTDVRSQETVSTTLLQGLQVLAIGSQSVASEEYADKEPGALAQTGKVNHRMVTLLVEPKQAEILQLAMQHGSMSLSMRNPLDATREARRMTRSDELAVSSFDFKSAANLFAAWLADPAAAASQHAAAPRTAPTADHAPAVEQTPAAKPQVWEATIIRAGVVEKRTFDISNSSPPQVDAPPPSDTDQKS
jgi:pilus assembly protein CpaB